MKVLFLLCMSFSVFAQKNDQLNFNKLDQTSFEEILGNAQKSKKIIFADVYTDWCGPCKVLDKTTFIDAEVVKKFNNEFILLKVNAEDEKGKILADKYKVWSYPTLLFIDDKGNLINRLEGVIPPKLLIEEGDFAKKFK